MEINTAKLIYERKRRGWALTEMAYRCKVSPSMISMIEHGQRDSYRTVRKMAKVLGLRLDLIMPEEKAS